MWGDEFLRYLVLGVFRILLHVFFNDVEVVGRLNVPKKGPVIFVGNHRNQFVDAMIMFSRTGRTPSFIIAEVSLKRKVIAFFAKILRCVPIHRPRDVAMAGEGTIQSEGAQVHGAGTNFKSSVTIGDELIVHQRPDWRGRVTAIESDTELTVSEPITPPFEEGQKFKVYRKIDQSHVYDKVWDELARGNSIGIFPEGSSHDRADLLPLKAGVTLMALGAAAKHNVEVQIVPCGLTYFHGHRFRGHCIVEFGQPLVVSPQSEWVERYKDKDQRRQVCSDLLDQVEKGLRGVTLNVPTYKDRQVALTVRSLYQPASLQLSSNKYQMLNRSFADILFHHNKDNERVQLLVKKVRRYNKQLHRYGFKDYQVAEGFEKVSKRLFLRMILRRALYLGPLVALALPGALLNLPVGLLARYVATNKARTIAPNDPNTMYGALDVIASYKIIIAGFGAPISYVVYFLAAWWVWGSRPALAFLAFLPIFSYASIRVLEKGMEQLRLLQAVFHLARARRELNSLKQTRAELQTEVRRLIDELSPEERGEEFARHGVHREMKQKWKAEEDERSQDGTARKRVLYRRRSYKKLDEFSGSVEGMQEALEKDEFL